jgi:hypothetical protein
MRKLLALSCLVVFLAATSTANAGKFLWHHDHMTLDQKVSYFNRSVEHDKSSIIWLKRVRANLRRNVRALAGTRYEFAARAYQELLWFNQALRWHLQLQASYQAKWDRLYPPLPAHYSAWLCIHNYEGSWQDDGAPYYGGLQMDMAFMARYGARLLAAKGTANNWTPLEQMYVAEVAYQSGRGFYPWPNTARACGLI